MTRLGAALAALLLAGCGLEQDVAVSSSGGPKVGSPAPPVQIHTLDGGVVDLRAERGHPVVIDFFGSWCGPCRKQQAGLDALAARYRPRGVVIVGDALRDDRATLQSYLTEQGVPYPAGLDDGRVAAQFGVLAPRPRWWWTAADGSPGRCSAASTPIPCRTCSTACSPAADRRVAEGRRAAAVPPAVSMARQFSSRAAPNGSSSASSCACASASSCGAS